MVGGYFEPSSADQRCRRAGAASLSRAAHHRRLRSGTGARGGVVGYGVVVDSVNVSVLLYVPVRSGSLAFTSCLKVIVDRSLETGAVHADLENSDPQRLGSENAPLTRWPGRRSIGESASRHPRSR